MEGKGNCVSKSKKKYKKSVNLIIIGRKYMVLDLDSLGKDAQSELKIVRQTIAPMA